MQNEIETMPGLTPAIYNPDLKWHAIQVTIFEHATSKGKSVKANIRAKLSKSENWNDCALNVMMNLQGRGRNARRSMQLLNETCQQFNERDVLNYMESSFKEMHARVSEVAAKDNPKWRESFLRSGFGRQAGSYSEGRRIMKPLNPGIIGHFDRASMTFGLVLGAHKVCDTLTNKLTTAQSNKGVIAYGLWLLEQPEYTYEPGEENMNERLNRFLRKS